MLTFYPDSPNIIIAEGSDSQYRREYQTVISNFERKLPLQYFTFDNNVPIQGRALQLSEHFKDDYIIFSGDDDYPILENLDNFETFLQNNEDYVIAVSPVLWSTLMNDKFSFTFTHAKTIADNNPIDRARRYARIQFPSYYGVTKTEHFVKKLEIFQLACTTFFGDFFFGFYDCLRGKLKCFNQYGFIRSRNSTHSYFVGERNVLQHIFNDPNTMLNLRKHIADYLGKLANISEQEGLNVASELMVANIAKILSYSPNQRLDPFSETMTLEYADSQQYVDFKKMVKSIHAEKPIDQTISERFIEQHRFIIECLKDIIDSSDNANDIKDRREF